MFISDAFEGAISDREIVEKSGFVDRLDSGDVVLADRGFTIEDMLDPKGVRLLIPPFRQKDRKDFTTEELAKSKILSRARIHVERFNERMKNYRILSGVIPHYLRPLLSQIVFVVGCLVNFQEPLVK